LKNTGIVRRIDELGRIVIPKEIRDILNITNGDELEIYVENDNIILHKYSQLGKEKDKNDKLFASLSFLTEGLLLLGDKDKIVSNGPYENQTFSDEIRELIMERKPYRSLNLEQYIIGENNLQGYFYFYPILHNSVIKGVIILVKSTPIKKEDEIFVRVLKNIIDNF
jgi:stage V sporulation protein T